MVLTVNEKDLDRFRSIMRLESTEACAGRCNMGTVHVIYTVYDPSNERSALIETKRACIFCGHNKTIVSKDDNTKARGYLYDDLCTITWEDDRDSRLDGDLPWDSLQAMRYMDEIAVFIGLRAWKDS